MKTLKFFLLAMFAFLAVSCADDVFTPHEGGDDDDPPIIIGGGGGSGGTGGGGGNGGGHRIGRDQQIQTDSLIRVEL